MTQPHHFSPAQHLARLSLAEREALALIGNQTARAGGPVNAGWYRSMVRGWQPLQEGLMAAGMIFISAKGNAELTPRGEAVLRVMADGADDAPSADIAATALRWAEANLAGEGLGHIQALVARIRTLEAIASRVPSSVA